MTFGLSAGAIGLIGAGAAVAGGAIAASGAKSAANTQANSAAAATQTQKQIADDQIAFQRDALDKQIGLQQPFRDLGLGAQNKLAYLLGLSDTSNKATDPAIQAIRNNLSPQFTTNLGGGAFSRDLSGMDSAVQAELAKQGASDPQNGYGSLMQDFGEAPPSVADFSMKDFQADPGYQFRMDEGQKALERSAAARGGLLSGRAVKDTLRFSQGLGAQEYGDAFSRYQTNRGNKIADWQNRLNLFNTNRANKLQPLQSLGGVAQTASNTMGGAAQNFATGASGALGSYGQAAGANIIGAGNAQAASQIAGGNAINGAIGNATSMYGQSQLLNRLFPSGGTSYGSFQSSPMASTLYGNGSLGD